MPNNSPTIVSASMDDEKLKASIEKMVQNLNNGLESMKKSTDKAVAYMQRSLQNLGNTKFDFGGAADGGASRRTKANNEETASIEKSTSATDKKTASLDQQAQAMQAAAAAGKKYSDEIIRQANAIRETKEWQEKGRVIVGDTVYYDKERANATKRDKQLLLSLEEQIAQAQEKQIDAERKAAQEAIAQAEAQKQVNQAAIGTAQIYESVHQMQERANKALKSKGTIQGQEDYAGTIQRVLGLQSHEILKVNEETDSYTKLNSVLKQLSTAYDRLTASERNSDNGKQLVGSMLEIQRAMREIQRQKGRPVRLEDVLAFKPQNIDQMADKLRELQAYRGGIDITKTGAANEIKQVDNEITRLKKDMDKYMSTSTQVTQMNNALTRSFNYMKNRLAFYFTVGASTSFVNNLIEVRSQYEMNEKALGILINSAERGSQIFNELSQMALVSPYTLIELSAAAKQLTAYDIAARDVVDTTRRIADMASAVGIPIERLTYALGQIKAYGYLNSRDNRMFANAGIPLVKQLADYYTELEGRLVSTADVYDRIKKKAVDYNDVMLVINRMTDEGGKFYDFQAKMAETMKVQLANLTLAWNNMLNDIGEANQGILVSGIGALKEIFLHWKDLEHVINEIVVAFGVYKAAQLLVANTMGTTASAIKSQILAEKAHKVTMLQKQALVRTLNADQKALIATQHTLTASDYRQVLSSKNLTKQKALLLVAFNKNNVALREAIANMGLLTVEEMNNITVSKALGIALKSLGISLKAVAVSIGTFFVSNWWMFALMGVYELWHAYDAAQEHVKELNTEAAEHAKQTFENLKEYLESASIVDIEEKAVNKKLSGVDAEKAWQQQKDKIDEASIAANSFIASLEKEQDINVRIAKSFDYLKDVERVAGVMKTMAEDAVTVSTTTLGGLFGEGLKDDIDDFVKSYEKYQKVLADTDKTESYREGYLNAAVRQWNELRGEIQKTTNSIYDFASGEGFNVNEQREFFERMISEAAQKEQMGQKETRLFRMNAEKEYYAYAKGKLEEQLQYQQGRQAEATRQRISELDREFNSNKTLQETFFAWLSEKHSNEVHRRLQNKTKQEIEQGEWLTKENLTWVEKMAKDFSKEYGVSFEGLHTLVKQANTWSINIPVFFRTIGQQISDIAADYEARTGKKFAENTIIKDATSQVDVIKKLKDEQDKLADTIETARKAGGKYYEDNKKAWEEQNNALISDIHSYGALTKAEEKAQKGSGKAQKKAEQEVAEAFKNELSILKEMQSAYDKLRKAGVDNTTAIDLASRGYEQTLKRVNATLAKYGISKFNASDFLGKDVNAVLKKLEQQRADALASGKLKSSELKELDVEISKLNVDAKTYNMDKITKGLNSELDKLKNEYELALDLDANPELGDVFADMMGLNKEQLSELPRDFEGVMSKLQKIIDDKLGSGVFNLKENLNKASFDKWLASQGLDADNERAKVLNSYVDYANKVHQDETKKQVDEWNKLLEKYAEYEYKRKMIAEEAAREMEIARKKGAGQDIFDAVEKKRSERTAQTYFEEFQQSPMWITATGNLAGMTDNALKLLAKDIERFKNSAKGLSAKNIKEINKALANISKEQKRNNPFKSLAISSLDAKERMATFDEEIAETEKKLDDLYNKQNQSNLSETGSAIAELTEKLRKLKDAKNKAGEIDATEIVAGINSMVQAAGQGVQMINELVDSMRGDNWSEAKEIMNDTFHVIEKGGQGAMIGAQIGKGYGAIIGAVVGVGMGLFEALGDNANKKIDSQIKDSEVAIKRLEAAYVDLQHAMDEAYGTGVVASKRLAASMKELELAELEHQLALEQSRDTKHRDEGKVADLQKQVKELRYEIEDTITKITNDLLGGEAGSFAEGLVDAMIDSFKKGEDYMKVFEEKFDDMVDNMIMKSITSRVVAQYIDNLWDEMDERIKNRSYNESEKLAEATKRREQLESMDVYSYAWEEHGVGKYGLEMVEEARDKMQKLLDTELQAARMAEEAAQKNYDSVATMDDSDISFLINKLAEIKPELGERLREILGEYYKFGETSNKELSALQQGIQGITEDTAGALEAYMNGMSQQVYLQSDILSQIRDAVVGFNLDVQVASMSQILLQLRSSYEVQMSIHSLLNGWNNPAGNAMRVELV